MKDEVTYKTLVDETTGETKTVMVLPQQKLFDDYNNGVKPHWHNALNDDKTSDEYKRGWTDAAALAQTVLFSLLLPRIDIIK